MDNRRADDGTIGTGVCHCGSDMDAHSGWDEHQAVEMRVDKATRDEIAHTLGENSPGVAYPAGFWGQQADAILSAFMSPPSPASREHLAKWREERR